MPCGLGNKEGTEGACVVIIYFSEGGAAFKAKFGTIRVLRFAFWALHKGTALPTVLPCKG